MSPRPTKRLPSIFAVRTRTGKGACAGTNSAPGTFNVGSHNRYKPGDSSGEREHDCNSPVTGSFRPGYATADELTSIEKKRWLPAREARNAAWKAFQKPITSDQSDVLDLLQQVPANHPKSVDIMAIRMELRQIMTLRDSVIAARKSLRLH